MDKNITLCLFYTMILILPAQMLGMVVLKEKTEKRQATTIVPPLSVYAGSTVPLPVFLALVNAYGYSAVLSNNISVKSNTDRESWQCANNSGWCRPSCRYHEQVDRYNSDICGSYQCCLPKMTITTRTYLKRQ